jgi:predicted transcriptional regulator
MPNETDQTTPQHVSHKESLNPSAKSPEDEPGNKASKSRHIQYSRKVLEARADRKKLVDAQILRNKEKRAISKQDDKLFASYKLRNAGLSYAQIAKILGISDSTVRANVKELGGINVKSFQENEAQIYDFIRARIESVLIGLSDKEFKNLVTGRSGALWFNSHFNNSQLLKGKPTQSITGVTVLSFKDWKRPEKPVQSHNVVEQLPDKS